MADLMDNIVVHFPTLRRDRRPMANKPHQLHLACKRPAALEKPRRHISQSCDN